MINLMNKSGLSLFLNCVKWVIVICYYTIMLIYVNLYFLFLFLKRVLSLWVEQQITLVGSILRLLIVHNMSHYN